MLTPLDHQAQARALRALRESLGLTQEKLAQRTGLSLATIKNIEYGKPGRSRPKVEVALLAERIRQSGIRAERLAELMDVELASVNRAVSGEYMGTSWMARAHAALDDLDVWGETAAVERRLAVIDDPGEGEGEGRDIA